MLLRWLDAEAGQTGRVDAVLGHEQRRLGNLLARAAVDSQRQQLRLFGRLADLTALTAAAFLWTADNTPVKT